MRKFGGVLASLLLLLMPLLPSASASAATCSGVANYGAVTVLLPQLSKPGDYVIWLRMQIDSQAHSKVLVEINQQDCLTIGGDLVTSSKQWQWVPYSMDGKSAATYYFDHQSNNTAKIIGVESSVKVDKIMVTPTGCVPSGSGDGCIAQAPSDEPGASNTVKTVQPLSSGPVSGNVYPTATIEAEADSIQTVSYSADGAFIQTVQGAGRLDTTLLSNGKHSIAIAITKVDGKVENEVTVIDVNNRETVLSPIIRWAKLHKRDILIVAAIIGGLILIRLMWAGLRAAYMKRRYRKFHGF